MEKKSDFSLVKIRDNISLVTGLDDASFFTSTNFNSKIKNLTDQFDQVFLCSTNKNAQLGLMALTQYTPGVVLVTGLRKTKKSNIKHAKTHHPINILLHD